MPLHVLTVMKIARKPIYAQQDCIDATERSCTVKIYRERHKLVVIAVSPAIGEFPAFECEAELTVHQLAWLLRNADKLTNEHS